MTEKKHAADVTPETIVKQEKVSHLEAEAMATGGGAAVGALLGSIAGPPGALAGAVVGSLVGAVAGAALDKDEKIREARDLELTREDEDAEKELDDRHAELKRELESLRAPTLKRGASSPRQQQGQGRLGRPRRGSAPSAAPAR